MKQVRVLLALGLSLAIAQPTIAAPTPEQSEAAIAEIQKTAKQDLEPIYQLMQKKQYQQAEANLRQLIASKPQNWHFRATLAQVLALQGRLSDTEIEAIRSEQAYTEATGNSTVFVISTPIDYFVPIELVKNGQSLPLVAYETLIQNPQTVNSAIATLNATLQKDPTLLPERLALARLLYKTQNRDQAIAQVRTALKQYPKSVVANYALASLLHQQSHDASESKSAALKQEAIALLRQVIALSPLNNQAYSDLIGAIDGIETPAAIEQLRQAHLKAQPRNYSVKTLVAWSLIDQGKFDDAIALLTEAIALKPKNSYAYELIGSAYRRKKDYAQAERYYRRAIELRPQEAMSYGGYLRSLVEQKRYAEAKTLIQESKTTDPGFLYSMMASDLAEAGEIEQAIQAYEMVLHIYTNYDDPRLSERIALSQLYLRQGDATTAREVLEAAKVAINNRTERSQSDLKQLGEAMAELSAPKATR
jgi:tetratricopeptide (TPR) repeat protein